MSSAVRVLIRRLLLPGPLGGRLGTGADRETWNSTQLESAQEHPAGQLRDTHLAPVTPVPPNPHVELQ